MITTIVGKRGQITLPSRIRKQAGIQEGDRLAMTVQKDRIVIQLLPESLLDLRGSVPVSGPQDFEAIRREALQRRAEQRQPHDE